MQAWVSAEGADETPGSGDAGKTAGPSKRDLLAIERSFLIHGVWVRSLDDLPAALAELLDAVEAA